MALKPDPRLQYTLLALVMALSVLVVRLGGQLSGLLSLPSAVAEWSEDFQVAAK